MDLSTFAVFKEMKQEGVGVKIEGEILKKCQKVILSIAVDVISVCEENKIWYELGGGTALGAVRHGGFIPWDDDIDLNVLQEDMVRLKEAIYIRFGNKYTFLDYSVPNYGLPMGKVMLNDSVYMDRESYGSSNCGFFIDLFPVVNIPDNAILRKIHGVSCMISGGLLSCRKFHKNRTFLIDLTKNSPKVQKIVRKKIFIGSLISFLSLETCARITNYIYGICKNKHSEDVSIPSGRKHYFGAIYPRSLLLTTTAIVFEGHEWQIVQQYPKYFTNLYGEDYMKIPPEEKREHHVLLNLQFPKSV